MRSRGSRIIAAMGLTGVLSLGGATLGAEQPAGAGAVTATTITAGGYDTCALLSTENVKCWGQNAYGDLGNGSTTNSDVPVAVKGLTGVNAIAAGEYHHTCAQLKTGTVECWGWNAWGQLGNGSTTNSDVPVAVTDLSGVTAVSAGNGHSCALLSTETVMCWGLNSNEQLGNVSVTNSSVPVAVSGKLDDGVTGIAAGSFDNCLLLNTGTVGCWGDGSFGDLGGGNGTSTDAPVPVAVKDLSGVTAIAAGGYDVCGLLTTGRLKCWGDNRFGALGNGSTGGYSTPVAVKDLSGVTAVAVGYEHACALLTTMVVKCWGDNSNGQLGNGTTTNSDVPVGVRGLRGVTAISAGYEHTCALLDTGTVECWGWNAYGQLGNGAKTDASVPVTVKGL